MTMRAAGEIRLTAGRAPSLRVQPSMMVVKQEDSREVNKNPHYQGMCVVSVIASHLHCIYFMHEQLSDLEMRLIKELSVKKEKWPLKPYPDVAAFNLER